MTDANSHVYHNSCKCVHIHKAAVEHEGVNAAVEHEDYNLNGIFNFYFNKTGFIYRCLTNTTEREGLFTETWQSGKRQK